MGNKPQPQNVMRLNCRFAVLIVAVVLDAFDRHRRMTEMDVVVVITFAWGHHHHQIYI